MGSKQNTLKVIKEFERLLEKQTGKAIRPYRADGYVNVLNRYGTNKDTTERYQYQAEPVIPDDMLTSYYESNGLFAKIIDSPAEEAVKHGFKLDIKDQAIENFYTAALDELDWEETCMTAIKWTRLFGGCIVVMLINDGRGIDEPLDWKNIKSIDDLRIYDRSLIQEDISGMFEYRPDDPFRTRASRLGMPEYYNIYSRYGSFRVHDSRCLVFQNGTLPENTTNSNYQMWGIPEYVKLHRAIRDAEIAHGSAVKLLDRSIQPVYKMKDLAAELATEEGEARVLRRLQTIDMARGLLNSITIDSEGEDYDFKTFQFSGVSDVIDSTCNYLSALTCIPQTILFGRSPSGMNATGQSDLENWYNYLERIQSRMIKRNLRYLLSVIFQAGVACNEIDEVPDINIEFNPLWSLSESEKISADQQKAAIQQTKAQTAQIYMDAQVIDPSEVRKKLADSDEFDIENMLDEYDEEDLFANMPQGNEQMMTESAGQMPEQGDFSEYAEGVNIEEHNTDPGTENSSPTAAPAATKLPEDMSEEEKEKAQKSDSRVDADDPTSWITTENGHHVPLDENGEAMGGGGGTLTGKNFSSANSGKNTSEHTGENKQSNKATTKTGTLKCKSPDDFDKYVNDNNLTPLYRGFSAPSEEKAEEYADTLKNGTAPFSSENTSALGKGVYFSESQTEAESYITRRNGENNESYGRYCTAALDVGAKIADQNIMNRLSEQKYEEANALMQKAFAADTPNDQRSKYGEQANDLYKMDIATFAASKGYDAMRDHNGVTVVMNQEALIVRDDSRTDEDDKPVAKGSVGVLVISDGRILTGIRKEGFKAGTICGPGGHVEVGETHEQAAIRETQEEFGITPKDLVRIGYGAFEPDTGLKPIIYMATDYEGDIANTDGEMGNLNFRALEDILNPDVHIFKPFGESLNLLIDVLDCPECKDIETVIDCPEPELMTVSELEQAFDDLVLQKATKFQKELTSYSQSGKIVMETPTSFKEAFENLEYGDIKFLADEIGTTIEDILSASEDSLKELYELICEENEINLDEGNSNSGNYGHGGRPGEVGGSSSSGGNSQSGSQGKRQHLSNKEKEKYNKRIVGQKTSDGVEIKRFSDHAFDRIAQRNLSPKRIENMLQSSRISADKKYPNSRRCYDVKGSRLVLDFIKGTIVTIEWRSQNK